MTFTCASKREVTPGVMRRAVVPAVVVLGAVLVQAQAPTQDWPQWRGPRRDAIASSFKAPASWPQTLTEKWKVEVGLGYATPILVGNRVFAFSRRGENETLTALDAETGKQIWQTAYPAPFKMNPAAARHKEGPKSTPTYAAGKLFTLGMSGSVTAFDAATGKQLWQRPGSQPGPLYATGLSPLVDGSSVIVEVGDHGKGALVALDVNNGREKWNWPGDGPAYGSPIAFDVEGVHQVIVFTQENLVGVSAESGQLLWKRPFTTRSTQNTITPLVYGQTVIVSGLDNPVTAFRIARRNGQWVTEDVWTNPDVPMYMSNAVIVRDMLFGMTHKNSGQFFLLDPKTGKTLWTSEPRQATNAAIVGAGDLAFALKDNAELLVGRPEAIGFQVLKTYTVADSSTWAQPVLAGNRLFVKDETKVTLFTFN